MDKVGVGRGEELLGALSFCLRAEDCRAVVHRRRPREPSLPSLSQSVSSSVLFRSRSLSDHLRHGHVPRQHPVLPLSSHVGAGTSLFPHCPASCVEEGRWHPSGAGFVPSLVLNVFHVFCGEIYSRSGVAGLPPHCSRELCEAKDNSPGAAVRHSVLEAPAPASGQPSLGLSVAV